MPDCTRKVGTFVVKIAAESLELGREQDRIRVVDLLRRVTAARTATAHAAVGVLDLVESPRSIPQPEMQ